MKKFQRIVLVACVLLLTLSACDREGMTETAPRPDFVQHQGPSPEIDVAGLQNLALSLPQDSTFVTDTVLQGQELQDYLDWAASLPADSVFGTQASDTLIGYEYDTLPPLPGDSSAVGLRLVRAGLFCRYFVAGVQGGGCGALPPQGGVICVKCEPGWPAGTCPSWLNKRWLHYDENGNVVCTGMVTADLGLACDKCDLNHFAVVKK
jgi:hypothetical protein